MPKLVHQRHSHPRPAHLAHHLPRLRHHAGRTRLKVARSVVYKVAEQIHRLPEVTSVDVNDTTGSILVRHQDTLEQLIAKLEAEEICELTGLPDSASDMLVGLGPKVLSVALMAIVLVMVGPSWIGRFAEA